MSENTITNESKSFLSVKRVLKLLSVLCIVFVFCPSFLVSCSGQNIEVGVMTAVKGMSMYGETIVEPTPIMLACLFLPIIILAVSFIKKITGKQFAIITVVCSIIDLVVWLVFKTAVQELAEENYCDFKVTGSYYINLVVLVVMVIIALLVIINRLQMEADLLGSFSNAGVKTSLDQMSVKVGQMSEKVSQIAVGVVSNVKENSVNENTIGYCAKCGKAITYGYKFCVTCGTAVPESMIAEAEETKRAIEEARKGAERLAEEAANIENNEQENRGNFCQQCGAALAQDALFCETCGRKVE